MRTFTPEEAGTVLKHIRRGQRIGAGVLGGAGAVHGALKKKNKSGVELNKKTRIGGAVVEGVAGGLIGHGVGGFGGLATGLRAIKPKPPTWLKGVKTKSDAKAKFRAVARQHHPDLGGSTEKMKKVNDEWSAWEGKFKEAMFSAFADELEKIAVRR